MRPDQKRNLLLAGALVGLLIYGGVVYALGYGKAATTCSELATALSSETGSAQVPSGPDQEASIPPVPVPADGIDGNGGTLRVGPDVKPGRYLSPGGESCYWARRSGADEAMKDIIKNGFGPGQHVVTIRSTDQLFDTRKCSHWKLIEDENAPTGQRSPE